MLGVIVPDRTFLGCPAHRPGATLNQPRGFQASGRSGVQARAASLEEAKSGSTNGVVSDGQHALDFDELTGLIKMVHSTDIVELELNSKKFKLTVKKKEALEVAEPQVHYIPAPTSLPGPAAFAPPVAVPPPAPAAPAPAPAAAPAPAPAAAAAPPPPPAVDGVEIVSPMSGTFYASPAPGEPPFVKVGDTVKKGQTVCIIEAMKLMNEIEAEASGTIVKVVGQHGKPVTPGAALFIIKP